ncbi:MAG: hypothetical protein KA138_14950 [Saprospiraceae bacterium]|nr:hypothetical protein [Saprospiraceae bacterium]
MDNNFDELRQIMGELATAQKQTQKQLGELGNKLGSFAEGLAYPTVERIMLDEFHMDTVGPIRSRKGSETLEIDAFGYSNGNNNTVMVGEIKSHFREHHVEQLEQACQRLFDFMPEHRGKKVYGMVIFVKGEQNAIQLAAKHGIYTVEANDENFKLRNPKGFVPKDFGV